MHTLTLATTWLAIILTVLSFIGWYVARIWAALGWEFVQQTARHPGLAGHLTADESVQPAH